MNMRWEYRNAKDVVNNEIKFKSEEGKILRRVQRELESIVWSIGKESNRKYIRDMEKKFGNEKVKVTLYEGVRVGDEYLKKEIDTNVKMYGNIEVSDEANEVLKLPPKFATFQKQKIEDI